MNEERLTCQTIGKLKGLQHGVSKVKIKLPGTGEKEVRVSEIKNVELRKRIKTNKGKEKIGLEYKKSKNKN